MPDEKPMCDVLRRKYNVDERHAGLYGSTGRRLCSCPSCRHQLRPTVERSKAALASHPYLDADKEYGTLRPLPLAKAYTLTAFELEGLDASCSLQRGNAWDAVPNSLAEHSVGLPSILKLPDGRTETLFQLPAKGLLLAEPSVAAAERELATHIYEICRRRPRLLAVLPTEPPTIVRKPLLKAALRCAGNRVPQTAVVRVNRWGSCWDVATANGKPLEIDLGTTCLIEAFATQGRPVPTRRYPRVKKHEGVWQVEDGDHLPNAVPGVQYRGPWWTVRGTDLPGPTRAHVPEPAWVSRYELSWRADGGRKWHTLGTLNGNVNEVDEIAHSFASVRGGLCARYLRVTPLDCEGGGAMRFGVYGEVQRANAALGQAPRQHTDSKRSGTTEDEQIVEYKLTQPASSSWSRFTKDGMGLGGDAKWQDISHSANRGRRRVEAAREARELAPSQYRPSRSTRIVIEMRGGDDLCDGVEAGGASDDDAEVYTEADDEDLAFAIALSRSLADAEELVDLEEQRTTNQLDAIDASSYDMHVTRRTISDEEEASVSSATWDSEDWCSQCSVDDQEPWILLDAK